MEFRLFFSNRRKDQARVDEIQAALRARIPNMPFSDLSKQVPTADDWKSHAARLINSSDALICIAGSDACTSEPVDWEIREAHRLGKPLIVARLAPTYAPPPSCRDLGIPLFEWDEGGVAGQVVNLLITKAVLANEQWNSATDRTSAMLSQYGVMVQSWEALIARRQTVNTLYVAALTALLAGSALLATSVDKTGNRAAALGVLLLCMVGAALSFNWLRTIRSYGLLSEAKSKVILVLEQQLPAQLFGAEWGVLEAHKYVSTTKTDTQTIWAFLVLFGACALASVLAIYLAV